MRGAAKTKHEPSFSKEKTQNLRFRVFYRTLGRRRKKEGLWSSGVRGQRFPRRYMGIAHRPPRSFQRRRRGGRRFLDAWAGPEVDSVGKNVLRGFGAIDKKPFKMQA
jgi:hypothetical protein